LNELSSIPTEAEERVTERYDGGVKKKAEYYLNGEEVGRRWFFEAGDLEMEISVRDGRQHGPFRTWYESGQLSSETIYVNGLEHGTARQWAEDGTLIGTYEMDHGTGLDLWWTGLSDEGGWHLSEARYMLAGDRHGFEWWIDADQMSVNREGHFAKGQEHGVQRDWNSAGRLRRGFPKYFVNGGQVTKRQYLRAAHLDSSLPPFRAEDNRPERQFPPEVVGALRPER
jgi:antitoxin component YwqK of YwqJK toxin-antitoxin module